MGIYEQLENTCDCIAEVKQSDVDELINLISMATCWTQVACETFLKSDRQEVIELKCNDCNVISFKPFYHPFEPDSFEFYLVTQKGIEETTEPLTEYKYSVIDNDFKVQLPFNCKCINDSCGCPTVYKILVKYVAGYEEIPDCLLPLFCSMLKLIIDKNTCDCSKCQLCDSEKQDLVDYAQDDNITFNLDNYFNRVFINAYVRELGMISLCEKVSNMWAVKA